MKTVGDTIAEEFNAIVMNPWRTESGGAITGTDRVRFGYIAVTAYLDRRRTAAAAFNPAGFSF